jgi:hypothetical protein
MIFLISKVVSKRKKRNLFSGRREMSECGEGRAKNSLKLKSVSSNNLLRNDDWYLVVVVVVVVYSTLFLIIPNILLLLLLLLLLP